MTGGRWLSVRDEQPSNGEIVITKANRGGRNGFVKFLVWRDGSWWREATGMWHPIGWHPTHWQP